VISLRQLGFSLDEIRDCLDRPGFSPLEVVGLHLARLREQLAVQQQLCARLEALAARLQTAEEASADDFLNAIEEMTMLETLQKKYFTPEQMDAMKAARETLGQEVLERGQEQWAELIADLKAAMERGADPASPEVQAMVKRWQDLLQLSTGGDPGIMESMRRLWQERGDDIVAQFGSQYDSRPVWAYAELAVAAGKKS